MQQDKNKKYDYKGRENYEFSMAAVTISLAAMMIIFIVYALVLAISQV